jgi:hypothetical protein
MIRNASGQTISLGSGYPVGLDNRVSEGGSAGSSWGRCLPIGEFGGDPEQPHCGMPLRSNCEGA